MIPFCKFALLCLASASLAVTMQKIFNAKIPIHRDEGAKVLRVLVHAFGRHRLVKGQRRSASFGYGFVHLASLPLGAFALNSD